MKTDLWLSYIALESWYCSICSILQRLFQNSIYDDGIQLKAGFKVSSTDYKITLRGYQTIVWKPEAIEADDIGRLALVTSHCDILTDPDLLFS